MANKKEPFGKECEMLNITSAFSESMEEMFLQDQSQERGLLVLGIDAVGCKDGAPQIHHSFKGFPPTLIYALYRLIIEDDEFRAAIQVAMMLAKHSGGIGSILDKIIKNLKNDDEL